MVVVLVKAVVARGTAAVVLVKAVVAMRVAHSVVVWVVPRVAVLALALAVLVFYPGICIQVVLLGTGMRHLCAVSTHTLHSRRRTLWMRFWRPGRCSMTRTCVCPFRRTCTVCDSVWYSCTRFRRATHRGVSV